MYLCRHPFEVSRQLAAGALAASLVLAGRSTLSAEDRDDGHTRTPVKHLVVIFQENVSFDHYFATYPKAANTSAGEPRFVARRGTPSVDGLTPVLLTANPNAANPFRLDRLHAATCDQDHDYGDEQKAYDPSTGLVVPDHEPH